MNENDFEKLLSKFNDFEFDQKTENKEIIENFLNTENNVVEGIKNNYDLNGIGFDDEDLDNEIINDIRNKEEKLKIEDDEYVFIEKNEKRRPPPKPTTTNINTTLNNEKLNLENSNIIRKLLIIKKKVEEKRRPPPKPIPTKTSTLKKAPMKKENFNTNNFDFNYFENYIVNNEKNQGNEKEKKKLVFEDTRSLKEKLKTKTKRSPWDFSSTDVHVNNKINDENIELNDDEKDLIKNWLNN
jgi:hypothetical protein